MGKSHHTNSNIEKQCKEQTMLFVSNHNFYYKLIHVGTEWQKKINTNNYLYYSLWMWTWTKFKVVFLIYIPKLVPAERYINTWCV